MDFSLVLKVIRPSISHFQGNWTSLATSLDTPRETVHKLSQDLILGTIRTIDVVHHLLHEWYGAKGDQASVEALIHALYDNNLGNPADLLVKEFYKLNSEQSADGISPSLNNGSSSGSLHLAAHQCDMSRVNFLIMTGANVNEKDGKGRTLLHRAAACMNKNKGFGMIKFLIKKGASVYMTDDKGRTFLNILIVKHYPIKPALFSEIVEYLVTENHLDLFKTTNWKYTVMQQAFLLFEPEMETLSLLHEKGVDFSAEGNHSLLKCAIIGKNSLTLIMHLLKLAEDSDGQVNLNECLLHDAAKYGTVEVLRFFVKTIKGFDLDSSDESGNTPLHCVCMQRYHTKTIVPKIKLLRNCGAGKEILENAEGQTPTDVINGRNDLNRGMKNEIRNLLQANA